MKYCPKCQATYADDTLRFCLQDGTPLADADASASETVSFTDEATLVSPKKVEPLNIPVENPPSRDWEQSRQTTDSASATFPPPSSSSLSAVKKPKTALIVFLTAFIMLLFFGGAIGAWFYFQKQNNLTASTTGKIKANDQNALPKTTPTPAPTPAPPANDFASIIKKTPETDPEMVKEEVAEKVDEWTAATESLNLNTLMNYYADTVDYYNKAGVSANFIKSDKQRAFAAFSDISMDISNLRVTPNAAGDAATAVFDKEWTFEGEESYSSGKVQSQLQLKKINDKWLITSEKDLRVYYLDK